MTNERPLYVKVCIKCGRQVAPHWDHNLGYSQRVGCTHGRPGLGKLEIVGWKRIQVIPLDLTERPDQILGCD